MRQMMFSSSTRRRAFVAGYLAAVRESSEIFYIDYDTQDVCWRVAKAYRKQAEAWTLKMKAMSMNDSKTWLAENGFPCSGSSKQIRANHMCTKIHASSNKGFEAEFAE